jgi:cysteinyl-tRNA synthetase
MLYDTYVKKEVEFVPLHPPAVNMYTCGPTVYGRPHIGNYSSFLMADLLRRWLEVGHDYKVTHVKNITDVGHLVKDADTGEDKIEKQAKEEHGSVTHDSVIAIARKYEAMYLEDEKILGFLEPKKRPRATEYIEEMKTMIEDLLKKNHAYVTEDGIYFSVETFKKYGTLSGNTLENLSAGARVEVREEKKHPADFALWKFCVGVNAQHALRWPSPVLGAKKFPDGFPGWHIECSAMSRTLLGDTIDIHTGGEDNIFPHHECEIAQSECVTGKPFVRLWLHKRRIDLAEAKMSKSLGNIVTMTDVLNKGYSAQDLRYYFLSVHYRTNLKFSWEGMEAAKTARKKIVQWLSEKNAVSSEQKTIENFSNQFSEAMDSDLNTPAALASVFECMTWSRKNASDEKTLQKFQEKIAATFGCFSVEDAPVPDAVLSLLEARKKVRISKDFKESDRLRDAIASLGYEVRDQGAEQIVKKL